MNPNGSYHNSGQGETNVWLTPRWVIDTLGPFDLDPCAAPSPRPFDTAREHVTFPDDGLAASWHGMVWLNPSYGPHVTEWILRLAAHGNGIALVFARVDTQWAQAALAASTAVVFPSGRLTFLRPDGRPGRGAAGASSMFIAYGPDAAKRLRRLEGIYAEPSRLCAPDAPARLLSA